MRSVRIYLLHLLLFSIYKCLNRKKNFFLNDFTLIILSNQMIDDNLTKEFDEIFKQFIAK